MAVTHAGPGIESLVRFPTHLVAVVDVGDGMGANASRRRCMATLTPESGVGPRLTLCAMLDSTIARLETAADSGTGVRFVGHSVMPDGEPVYVGWDQIHDEARAVGRTHDARLAEVRGVVRDGGLGRAPRQAAVLGGDAVHGERTGRAVAAWR